jgi:ribosomal-protein-alanine N-acetyltransferase
MAFEAFNGDTSRRCSTALAPPPAPGGYSSAMPNATTAKSSAGLSVRRSKPSDLDALWDLENQVFDTNRMSRRSLRRLLAVPTAAVLVAEDGGRFAGAAIVLFRANSAIGRLYSLAVAPRFTGRGIGSALVTAVEKAARSRKCRFVRLEVHAMTGWVILVDQPRDLPNAETPHKVITTSEYLARPAPVRDGPAEARQPRPLLRLPVEGLLRLAAGRGARPPRGADRRDHAGAARAEALRARAARARGRAQPLRPARRLPARRRVQAAGLFRHRARQPASSRSAACCSTGSAARRSK